MTAMGIVSKESRIKDILTDNLYPERNNAVLVHILLLFNHVKTSEFIDDNNPAKATKKNHNMIGWYVSKEYVHMTTQVPSIDHEVAHMVEIKDKSRIVQEDFGFANAPKTMTPNGLYAAFARECRVRAIQCHLNRDLFGLNRGPNPYIIDDMPKPFGKFKDGNEIYDWGLHIMESTYRNWSLDRIVSECEVRSEYIKEHQETL